MMKRQFEDVKRIVIKIGTSSLVLANGKINLEKIDHLAFVISSLMNKGKEVILVSSGAMGFGLDLLKMAKRPSQLAKQQAVSSVGQVAMMSLYSQIFAHYQTTVSQILLTRDVVVFPESLANVTNAFESLIIHEKVGATFIPMLEAAISKVQQVEWRADEQAKVLFSKAVLATEEDYAAEFLDYIMSVHLVSSLDEAISWINQYTSHHSEAIITANINAAERFQDLVDSAAVYVNASTRFTDGFVFGLGAEIGISTQKMHARGPMGLEALTSSKYLINGNGQIRS